MKITHNNKTYIDAATHAGLRCWVTQGFVEFVEVHQRYLAIGDYAKDELIRYAHDPDGYRHGDILITDAEDHRKHWPLRNTHRHPLEVVGEKPSDCARRVMSDLHKELERGMEIDTPSMDLDVRSKFLPPAPQPVDGGEWPKWAVDRKENPELVFRLDGPKVEGDNAQKGASYTFNGRIVVKDGMIWSGWWGEGYRITPTQAAEWLRNNGHEAVADEIEGDRFEPVGTLPVVGDVLRHRDGGRLKVKAIDVVDRYYYESRSANGFHRLSWSGFTEKGWRILKRRAAK